MATKEVIDILSKYVVTKKNENKKAATQKLFDELVSLETKNKKKL